MWSGGVRVALPFTIGAVVSLGACGRSTPPQIVDDFGQCQPSGGDLGSTGCTDVLGNIVGARGQPLAGVDVGLRQSSAGGQFNTPYVQTDAQGLFRLRLTRVAPPGSPDTASVWVGATVRPTPPQSVAAIFDSALVPVRVAPIGRIPEAARVTISLPVQ
jgi:hypothetical protein